MSAFGPRESARREARNMKNSMVVSEKLVVSEDRTGTLSLEAQLATLLHKNHSRVMDLMRSMDHDNNGVIDRSEFTIAVRTLGFEAEPSAIHAVFDAIDSDASGIIEFR